MEDSREEASGSFVLLRSPASQEEYLNSMKVQWMSRKTRRRRTNQNSTTMLPSPQSKHPKLLLRASLLILAATAILTAAAAAAASSAQNANLGSQSHEEQKSTLQQSQTPQSSQTDQQIAANDNNNNKQPKAEALKSLFQSNKQVAPQAGSSTTNVITIKYANVTKSSASFRGAHEQSTNPGDLLEQSVSILKLYEPLSVSVIESKFAHSIELFDVSQNQLSTLSNNLFCPLSNEVRLLNVSHNLLENFDSLGLISQTGQLCLNELRILDMSFNLIKHLPATGVASLHNLEILNLSNNLIESLDELSLSSLFRLTKLDLSNNKIKHLPLVLFQKSYSMQILKLQSNQLQITINQTFLAGLISLEELNLSHNNISQVVSLAFMDKVNLTRVDLSHNKLSGLHKEVLRVSSSSQLASSSAGSSQSQQRHRIHHNGQFAGLTGSAPTNHKQPEFLLSWNPFVCDCHLEWMRSFQASSAISKSVLAARVGWPAASGFGFGSQEALDPYGAQLLHLSSYQSDQAPAPVIPSSDSSNNISEILTGNFQAPSSGDSSQSSRSIVQQQQHSSHSSQYARIGDLNLIKCSPLFRRNSQRFHNQQEQNSRRSNSLPSAAAGHHHQRSLTPPDGHHKHEIDLISADPSNFLCRYRSHCFALCHCCEFDACDCEMICPTGCNCYYDSTWKTNIIDCSSNNHTIVPERIPMDVTGLYLDGNNIDSLKPSNLIARKSLKTLYLNSSNLQYIANRTFNGLIELQSLYLNDNMLRSLQGHEFEPLAQLKALYLQSNRLDFIGNQTFIYLRSLEILDLSNNRLTSNNLDLFWSIGHHNVRLRQLSIAHNWWSCQCSSINRFRQILKQKFLLNGSVNIADKNQLRCYYNSTTVGPLILQEGAGQSQLQQPLYAASQTLLTEINQCSNLLEESQRYPQDINPPQIQQAPPQPEAGGEFPGSEGYYPAPGGEQERAGYPAAPSPPSFGQFPAHQRPFSDQPEMYPPNMLATPSSPLLPSSPNNQNRFGPAQASSMPLSSFILLCMLCLLILVIASSVLVFLRQQQQSFHQSRRHKKSSAASTTSGSSSASSTAASSLNKSQARAAASQQLQYPHHQHLIMSNGSQGATSMSHQQSLQHMSHHHHSASSQSNIYAALVSPATGNSTTLANPTATINNNNLYSNSSTASHHSSSASGQLAPGRYQQQQQQVFAGWSQQSGQQPHQQIYQQPFAGNLNIEGHYAGLKASSAASYKAAGSLYNYQPSDTLAGFGPPPSSTPADWLPKMPKVKQLVSKLVNKSLSRYRACSRDELSSITSNKIYDAFISYDKRDEQFVTQHLSAELEHGHPQYRVADRFRDLPLPSSAYIAEAITSVIGCSHRTIVVLTENYLSSDWCRYELQAALQEASLDKSHKIIAVVLDPKCLLEMDQEMRALLTNCQVYQPAASQLMSRAGSGSPGGQLLQLLDGNLMGGSPGQEQQLIASLGGHSLAGNQQQQQVVVSATQTAQLATSKITFINYNERKFWHKMKQLMPLPRPSTQTLTLTTKN